MHQHLLDLAFKMHEKLVSDEKESGEYFNIFRILRIETREVKTHSNFLTELLDPNCSHRLGTTPLEEFLRVIGITNADASKAKVTSEFTIGTISQDGRTGGRIDILIDLQTRPNQLIAIENKIYAGDQENQLQRYHAHTKTLVYYLTLHGGRPSSYAMNGLSDDLVQCISYADHITIWLKTLIDKAEPHDLVRATLVQYKYLLKDLTGKSRRATMTQELANRITEKQENLTAYFTLLENQESVLMTILENSRKYFENCAKALGLTVSIQPGCIFFDFSEAHPKVKELGLRIGFGSDDLRFWNNAYIGIYHDKRADAIKGRGLELFKNAVQPKTENWGSWIAGYWKEYNDGKTLLAILNSLKPTEPPNDESMTFMQEFKARLEKIHKTALELGREHTGS